MAEDGGFEPPELLHPLAFETSAISHLCQATKTTDRVRFERTGLLHPHAFQACALGQLGYLSRNKTAERTGIEPARLLHSRAFNAMDYR